MRATSTALVLAVLALAVFAQAYVLPGTKPQEYQRGELVEVKVVQLDSVRTQIPLEYYSLPFCRPEVVETSAENLGEVLSGDVIQNSPYEVYMKTVESCKILCKQEFSDAHLTLFSERIEDDYRVNWMLDNLPASTKYYVETLDPNNPDTPPSYSVRYEKGFSLGFVGSDKIANTVPGQKYINNHVRLTVHIHEDPAAFTGFRVVGFEVEPFSVRHHADVWNGPKSQLNTCNPLAKVTHDLPPQTVSDPNQRDIIFTYDVQWERSDIKWASRWDQYLRMSDPQVHWFSIINSIVIALFLSAMVAVIMIRTLHRDLIRYNSRDPEDREAAEEETGWKLVHADVFRAPSQAGLLCVLIGTGSQILGMTALTILFAALGFLSPANRGALMTALLIMFAFMGCLAGYMSARFYKAFDMAEWRQNTLWTSLAFPSVAFCIFFILNLVLWGQQSSAAVPFVTLLSLLVLWFGISVPLVYLGAYFGHRTEIKWPTKINHFPRQIPEQAWYTQSSFSILLGGILPFGAVFIEAFFIMSSVWHHQFYYAFAFLFLVFLILIVTCAEVTIVLVYFQLCSENYAWHWRSALSSGSTALYLFLYSIIYFFTRLDVVHFASGVLFFGYMFLFSLAFFVMCATIGYLAAYTFICKIYSSVKLD